MAENAEVSSVLTTLFDEHNGKDKRVYPCERWIRLLYSLSRPPERNRRGTNNVAFSDKKLIDSYSMASTLTEIQ